MASIVICNSAILSKPGHMSLNIKTETDNIYKNKWINIVHYANVELNKEK